MNIKALRNPSLNISKLVLPITIVVLCAVFQIANSSFFSYSNLTNVSRQSSILAIAAVGQTIVIICGGIDLSQGSIIGLVSVFGAAQVIEHGFFQGMLIVVVLCAVIGLTHGVLVSKGKIPAFIVTMGSMTFLRGAAYVYSNGMPISGLPGGTFAELGNGSFLHIPVPLILVVISFALGFFILKFTVIGRDIYSIGGNEEAALLSGISATKGKIIAFVLSAVFTGIAGMVLTSRVAVGLPTMGDGFQLQAIAAAVIGGTSLKGGEGSMIGTILGILLVSVIGNGLNLLRVSSFVQLMINGVIIVLAVWFDSIKNK